MGQMMNRKYELSTLTVTVDAPKGAHDRINHYFPQAKREAEFVRIELVRSPQPDVDRRAKSLRELPPHRHACGHPQLEYEVWCNGPGEKTFLPRSDRETLHIIHLKRGDRHRPTVIQVFAEDEQYLGRTCVRLMRQLQLRYGEKMGGLFGHGAALVKNRVGIVLAGLSGAGKTTIALTLAARYGFNLIGSDKLALVPKQNTWYVIGIPVPWRIADGTIGAVPQLRRAFEHPLYREDAFLEGKFQLTTAEIEACLSVQSVRCAPLNAIVVLERCQQAHPQVQCVEGEVKVRMIESTLFNPLDRIFGTDWLSLTQVPNAFVHSTRAAIVARATTVLRVRYKLEQENAAVTLARSLLQLVKEEAASCRAH